MGEEKKPLTRDEQKALAQKIMDDPHSTVADRQVARIFLGLPEVNDNQ